MEKSFRVAVGGFQHETNTFATARAAYADFELHDGWPGLSRGPQLPAAVAGLDAQALLAGAARCVEEVEERRD